MHKRTTGLRNFRNFTLIILLYFAMPAIPAAAATGYTFGIGPTQSATELAKHWTPIMQYLTEKSGVQLQFKTAKDIPTFQQQMKNGEYDFAHINPYHYLVFNKSSGYTAFAREKDGKLIGVLLVQKDSPVKDVSELNGKTIAFPAANALAATWLPMHMLHEKNVVVTPQFVNSMDSVYISVAKGLFPAGGGELRTWGVMDPEVKKHLRILWTSEQLPPFAFVAHPRVPRHVMEKIQKALDEMDSDPRGHELLKANNFKGIESASDADYNVMRRMNIKPVAAK